MSIGLRADAIDLCAVDHFLIIRALNLTAEDPVLMPPIRLFA
jgi:hypothetical protein